MIDKTIELANKWLDVSYRVREERAESIEVEGVRYVRADGVIEVEVTGPVKSREMGTSVNTFYLRTPSISIEPGHYDLVKRTNE